MKKTTILISGLLSISVLMLVILIVLYTGQTNTLPEENSSQAATTGIIEQTSVMETTTQAPTIPDWAVYFEDEIIVDLLPVNPYSRPGTALTEVNAIVIHYVGNPGTTAAQNRSYFENLMETKEAEASSHFIVGLDGEIIQCVPLNEYAYASNKRNADTISIESCHPDDTGKYNDVTYDSMVALAAYLCVIYDLDPMEDIIRHYDVTGKECPRYFVDNEDEWDRFKQQVEAYIKKN